MAITAQLSNPLAKLPGPTIGVEGQRQPKRCGRRLSDGDIEQLRDDYLEGRGVVELARSYQIHRDTVNRHLKRSGVGLRSGPILDVSAITGIVDRYASGESS